MPEPVEIPAPTLSPLLLALGVALVFAGLVLHFVFAIVGGVLALVGIVGWVGELLPGRGHVHVETVPDPVVEARPGTVEQAAPGVRFLLPREIHPISAGLKGGLVGGLLMPVPAILYGLVSGHGIWFPVNLLVGMVAPGLEVAELERFSPGRLAFGLFIHACISLVLGLAYGVLLPTLPTKPFGPLLWGGLLLPLLWTAASYGLLGLANPLLARHVDWPWFIASQFVFGISAALVVRASETVPVPPVGPGAEPR